MRSIFYAITIALAVPGSIALADPTPAYSVANSQFGTLLANPATKAVLVKHIPEMIERLGDNMERVEGMTLKEVQDALKAYAPDVLTDAKLAAIDQDLAKIPSAK